MKRIFAIGPLLILLSAGCATTLPPAEQSPTQMERADAIWIYTDDAPKDAYRRIAQIITDHGYTISSSDATLMNISTEPKTLELSTGEALAGTRRVVTVNASVREPDQTVIKIVGQLVFRNMSTSNNELDSRDERGWNELTSIAEAYPNGEIQYSRNL